MGKRAIIIFILSLVLLLLAVGNHIHLNSIHKLSRYLNAGNSREQSKFTIFVEVDKKRLSLIDKESEETIKYYPIASGKESSPTPLGTFAITEKAQWGEGFGSRWIGLSVPWGIYGIHGTNKPGSIGSSVSAGCIRMRNRDIEELYDLVTEDTMVYISNGDYGAFGSSFRTLSPGDRGADVLEVQKRLKQLGYFSSDLDGIYGELMKKAVLSFLNDRGQAATDKITEEIYQELGIILME